MVIDQTQAQTSEQGKRDGRANKVEGLAPALGYLCGGVRPGEGSRVRTRTLMGVRVGVGDPSGVRVGGSGLKSSDRDLAEGAFSDAKKRFSHLRGSAAADLFCVDYVLILSRNEAKFSVRLCSCDFIDRQ